MNICVGMCAMLAQTLGAAMRTLVSQPRRPRPVKEVSLSSSKQVAGGLHRPSGLERWTAGGGEAAAETLMKDILRLPVGTPQPRQRDREQGADRQRGSCASCIEELRARPVWGLLLISSSVGGLSVPVRWEKANPSQSSLSGSNWRTGFTPGSKTLPPPSPWGLKFHH